MNTDDLHDDILFDRGYTRFILRHVRDKNGDPAEWGMFHINGFGPGALLLALTDQQEIVLERSYRIPLSADVIELPGGCNDVEGETSEDVARRELKEETGYTCREMIHVTTFPESPGMSDSHLELFLGLHAIKTTEPSLGPSEEITTFLLPFLGAIATLSAGTTLVDPKVYAAIALVEQRLPTLLGRMEKR